mmetsp:Transcript_79899/g.247880  ORF Transcript_79899/g.247880 Transcript_79899/m.247880 type:complete len:209 (+) Transcript_79899:221-847(+)
MSASCPELRLPLVAGAARGGQRPEHRAGVARRVLAQLEECLGEHEAILRPPARGAESLHRALVASRQRGRPGEVAAGRERRPQQRPRALRAAERPLRDGVAERPHGLAVADLGDQPLAVLLGARALVRLVEEAQLHVARTHRGTWRRRRNRSCPLRNDVGAPQANDRAGTLEVADELLAEGLHLPVMHHVGLAGRVLDPRKLLAERLP